MNARRRKIIAAVIFAPLLVVVLLLAGVFVYLQTDSGRDMLARQIEQAVNDPAGLSLELGPIQGNPFSDFSLASLQLKDPSGVWLSITDISLDWSPLDLLGGKLRLNKFNLSSLDVMRAPVLPDSPEEEASSGALVPLPIDISLRQIHFEQVHLGESLLGRDALMQVSMNLKSEVDGFIQSTLDIIQLDAHQGSAIARVKFHPLEETLSVDVALREPEGGLLARALDLPGYPEINVSFVGQGPLSDWKGQIDAAAGELFSGDLSLHSSNDESDTYASDKTPGSNQAKLKIGESTINLKVAGGLKFSEEMTASVPLVDDTLIAVGARLAWDSKQNLIDLVSLQIQNTSLDVSASGHVDLDEEKLNFTLSSNLLETSELNSLIAPAALSRGNITVDATGTFDHPSLTATFQIGGIVLEQTRDQTLDTAPDSSQVPPMLVGEVFGSINTDFSLGDLTVIPVTGSVALTEIRGLPPEATGLLGSGLRVELDSHYRLDSGIFNIPLLRARGKHVSADIRAALATRENTASAELSVLVDDLALVTPLQGKLRATASLQSLDIAREATGTIQIQAQELNVGDKGIQDLISAAPLLRTDIALKDENLHLSNIDLTLSIGRLGGQVQLPLSFASITGDIFVDVEDLSRLNTVAGSDIKGAARLETTLAGPLADPGVKGTLSIKDLALQQNPLGNLETAYEANNLATGAAGDVKARLSYPGLPINVALDFALPDYQSLHLTDIRGTADSNRISGTVKVPFDGAPLTGEINGQLPDLASLSSIAGTELGGRATADVLLSNRQGQQHVAADLGGDNLTADGVGVRSLKVTTTSVGDLADPAIDVTAKALDLSVGDRVVEQLEVAAEGKLTAANFTFALSSLAEPALQLKGQGQYALPLAGQTTATSLQVSSLNGSLADKNLALKTPFSVISDQGHTRLSPFQLGFDQGMLLGSGELTPSSANADFEIRSLPLALLTLVAPDQAITGRLDGKMSIALTPEDRRGQITLTAADIELAGEGNTALPPITNRFSGTLAEGRFDFTNEITGIEPSTMVASGSLPVVVGFAPITVDLPDNRPISGRLKVDSNIQNIWRYLALDTQEMAGKLLVDTQLAGTLSNPEIIGGAQITGGRYENIEHGTLLHKLELAATVQNSQNLLLQVDAVDGKGGTLKTSGAIGFQDLVNPLIDLNTQLTNLAVLDQDQISVQTDGIIAVKGTPSDLSVAGDITTREINLNIGSAVAPSVVNLDVTEKNRPGVSDTAGETLADKKANKRRLKVALDLRLSMPRKVFIRGKGLDSEWEGRFTITGTAADPVIEGYLSPVRGQFSFAGKDFKLQKGKIALLGGTEIDPELDLSAVYEARNVTAVVSINGTASNPKIAFSSPDGLPQDEVLSQVLFGKAAGKLTPVEALQLASAVASLSGKIDSGGGIMDFARETLGVDVLSAGTDAETGAAQVSVGKYINDSIYVGVDQGTAAGSTRAKVQIELTPNVTLESETGQTADSKVGVFWKWDY